MDLLSVRPGPFQDPERGGGVRELGRWEGSLHPRRGGSEEKPDMYRKRLQTRSFVQELGGK